jgi:cell division septum initiation protein DivIVA
VHSRWPLTGGGKTIDILKMLDQLEELVENSRELFGRAYGVNKDQFFMLTNKIRASLPDEVKKASRIANESERMLASARQDASVIVEDARREGTKITEEARREQQRLLADSEIHRLAAAQARELVESAQKNAQACREGADEYAREVLDDLEDFLTKFLGAVRRGKESLEGERAAPSR